MSMATHAQLNSMSTEALRNLNNMVVGVLRQRQTTEAYEKARKFSIGQMVNFKDKWGRPVTMRVERINVKTVSGYSIDPVTERRTNWRVAPSFLSPVEVKLIAPDASKATF